MAAENSSAPDGAKPPASPSSAGGTAPERPAGAVAGPGGLEQHLQNGRAPETRDAPPAGEVPPPAKKQRVAVEGAARQGDDVRSPTHREGGGAPCRKRGRPAAAAGDDSASEEDDGEEDGESAAGGKPATRRAPKRKVVLLMGYCGTKFRGMQVNPGTFTVEGELIRALCKIGSISDANAADSKKVQLRRAARTDKGVHAAGQVVSMKLIVDLENFLEKLNAELDEDIRVYDFMRVAKSFHPKNHCASRIYEYFMPTYAMSDVQFGCPQEPSTMPVAAKGDEEAERAEGATDCSFAPGRADAVGSLSREPHSTPAAAAKDEEEGESAEGSAGRSFTPEQVDAITSFRLPARSLAALRGYMAAYVGSHNFHNYSPGQKFGDQSSRRFMKEVKVDDPVVIDGMEWISVRIDGQSFMLNQIRKMIGLVVLMIRNNVPIDLIPRTFANVKINIPRAPSYPLMLERPAFDPWNRRMRRLGKEELSFAACMDKMQAFREDHIYPRICKAEREGNLMANWLAFVDSHMVQYGFLNSKGEIPPSAVLAPVESGSRERKAAGERTPPGATVLPAGDA